MIFFLDTEFIEKPNTIDLISIGLVSLDDALWNKKAWHFLDFYSKNK